MWRTSSKSFGGIVKCGLEHLDHGGVKLLDELHEIITGLDHIVALVVEVLVAFFQRLELLGGQRIDLAKRSQVAAGLVESLLLFLAVVWHGLEAAGVRNAVRCGVGSIGCRIVGIAVALAIRMLQWHRIAIIVKYRNRLIGAILAYQFLQGEANEGQQPLSERL